ncbi:hypothetical protein Ddye_019574 [Dipteronia dyeriana]|uniref:Gnk2-homologous domain-containing protein n=1 Tax=Dipteronia dyeriana TaxID=168575 RepID=A0AAD9TY20_9ROSI|nr:hypothetical protein Ddye_019574 [Dipteronia dyeriana]
MPSLKLSMLFFTFLSLFSTSLFSFTTAADPTYLFHFCSSTNFSRNSTYQTNLNRLLLSSLPSNGSDGFHNATFGQVPNRVYGLFLCRGDVTAATCQNCVTFATGDAPQRCPVSKGITIWYDECLLRYSDSNFFSTSTEIPTVALLNTNNVSDPTRFDQTMGGLMNLAATQAADSPKRFATRKGNFTVFQDIYCLVQCTPDLSSSDCNRCLRMSISNLPTGKPGARRLYPSCYSRYEMYPFYNENLTETPAPAPTPVFRSPPTPVSLTRHKGNNNSLLIIAIVVPIVVSVLLFVLGYCFLARRARERKKSNAIPEEIDANDITTAWKHWREGTPMQLLDSNLTDSYSRNEVMRCIHVGLLCVQEDQAERPTMATVILMLNSYSVTLPLPQQPAFFLGSRTDMNMYITKGTDSDKSASKSMPWSVDDASITELDPR